MGNPLPGDDLFKDRLAIPYLTPSGTVAMKFRSIDDTEPRFLTFTGTSMKRLYNTSVLLEPHLTVYLCEGEPDTWTAHLCGLPCVGVPGVNNWDKRNARIFRNRRVIVLADGDDSGQGKEFAERVLADIDDGGIILFEGQDVNSYYLEHRREGLLKRVGWTV